MIPLDPQNDSLWHALPSLHRRTARQRFIFRAAQRHGLTSPLKAGRFSHDRVEKNFYNALMDCPLPDDSTLLKYEPREEDYFIHLTLKRLEGLQLPISLDAFAPK